MFNEEQKTELEKKLDPKHVAQRKQGFGQVSYIEGWHAIAEANRIFGFDGWARETVILEMVNQQERKIGKQQKDGWGVTYTAKVRVEAGGVVREGVGAGHGIDLDLGQAHESAIKEAETDAMKRALMTFGNQFGLALYDKTQSNVGVEPQPPSSDIFNRAKAKIQDQKTPEALNAYVKNQHVVALCQRFSEGQRKAWDIALEKAYASVGQAPLQQAAE